MSSRAAEYPCACCGYLVFEQRPGSYEICPICFWEDDIVQLRWVDVAGGANSVSLVDAQRNYATLGCCEARFLSHVRAPVLTDRRDPEWRIVDLATDREPHTPGMNYRGTYPDDSTRLYYWRASYWRSGAVTGA